MYTATKGNSGNLLGLTEAVGSVHKSLATCLRLMRELKSVGGCDKMDSLRPLGQLSACLGCCGDCMYAYLLLCTGHWVVKIAMMHACYHLRVR